MSIGNFLKLIVSDTVEEYPEIIVPIYKHRMRKLPCQGYRDYWGEFDCGYYAEIGCEDCLSSGRGALNPYYSYEGNKRLSFILERRWLRKRAAVRFLKNHEKFITLKIAERKSHTEDQ